VPEEGFEVMFAGRRLPYTTERMPIGLRMLRRLRLVTQITISASHEESRSSVRLGGRNTGDVQPAMLLRIPWLS
jgi:hypothetical protein